MSPIPTPPWHPRAGLQELNPRDYFAAKAMQAIMGSDRYMGIIGVNNYQHRAASDAYAMADAMLRARAA